MSAIDSQTRDVQKPSLANFARFAGEPASRAATSLLTFDQGAPFDAPPIDAPTDLSRPCLVVARLGIPLAIKA
jgi:hypothetical protein